MGRILRGAQLPALAAKMQQRGDLAHLVLVTIQPITLGGISSWTQVA